MAIELAEKYLPYVDEIFTTESKKELLTNQDFSFESAHTVVIYKISTGEMNDYGRSYFSDPENKKWSCYGDIKPLDATTERFTLQRDRSFTFTVDALDEDETVGNLNAATALARQVREKVVPEVDTHVYMKMCNGAGYKPDPVKLTATNLYGEIIKAGNALDNAEVPEAGRVLVVTPDTYLLMKKSKDIVMETDIGNTSKADGDGAREALQKMVDWAEEGYFGSNWTGVIDNSAQILAFTTGAAAMNIAGSWDATTISENNPDLNFGAFTIPSEDGTTGLVGTSANGFSVNAASDNMDAAVAFANYCATKEAQTIWVQSQGAVSGSEDIEASTEIAKEISESGGGTTYRSWQNVLSSYSSTGNASTIWDSDFMKVFDGQMTVDELMDEIAAEME